MWQRDSKAKGEVEGCDFFPKDFPFVLEWPD